MARPTDMALLMDDVPAGGANDAVNDGHPAGDCMRACVATILELPLDEVPHFVQYVEHPAGTDPHLWWWALLGFCGAHGWHVRYVDEDPPGGWCLIAGKSPRGHQHVVVGFDGAMVHDPHPSRAGVVEPAEWFAFERGSES